MEPKRDSRTRQEPYREDSRSRMEKEPRSSYAPNYYASNEDERELKAKYPNQEKYDETNKYIDKLRKESQSPERRDRYNDRQKNDRDRRSNDYYEPNDY